MAAPAKWLLVAAEAREFAGLLRRASSPVKLDWPAAAFAREILWNGGRWILLANGPGPRSIEQVLTGRPPASGVISTGFCGALDPALQVGDIVVAGDLPAGADGRFRRGEVISLDRVAATASEKRRLRESTGAAIVEMEWAAVARKANAWGVPSCSIRAVSDTAAEDLPLDFNLYRDSSGRFSRSRIALAAMTRPWAALPGLLRFDRNCNRAAESLGEFFATCKF